MGYFKRTLHRASDTGEWYYIYEPTVVKRGAIQVKGKEHTFARPLKRKPG